MVLNDVNQITDRWHLVSAEPVLAHHGIGIGICICIRSSSG